ncbi:hypothetical protein SAMN06295912_10826 [Sphingomonas laterariae]|uniref:Uncharacterized protein n=1 Tax=Edaphosphingomonas laterariae TaxID=861865 RepID=A0A239F2I2_9SPHN|nr:hypothetical protein [Sphingomonas laterariae]SNS51045.1 hypothetical protein SAMN06295912_10826 [Sphingomonas laterariae]
MKAASPPIRFLAAISLLWIGTRIWWLLPEDTRETIILPEQARADTLAAAAATVAAGSITVPLRPVAPSAQHRPPRAPILLAAADTPREAMFAPPAAIPASSPPPIADLPAPTPAIAGAAPSPSRWSGNIYLFARDGGGDALAAGGQLGGGQIGGRIAWRINRGGPSRAAIATRAYLPLDDAKAAEGAVGLDFHPLPGQPLRLSVERRFDLGGHGRNAWSAYAAGGFWRDLGKGLEADGYAQAGMVGARSTDLFADGALRVVHRRDIAPATALRIGGGVWGGAQPGVERLDIGPRVALSLPVGGTAITAAIEGRFRVAGDAAPGSGAALTLASDF